LTIDKKSIKHAAEIAKLAVAEKEASALADEFNKILNALSGIEVKESDESYFDFMSPVKIALREDQVELFTHNEELFQNSFREQDGHIAVPRVMEQE